MASTNDAEFAAAQCLYDALCAYADQEPSDDTEPLEPVNNDHPVRLAVINFFKSWRLPPEFRQAWHDVKYASRRRDLKTIDFVLVFMELLRLRYPQLVERATSNETPISSICASERSDGETTQHNCRTKRGRRQKYDPAEDRRIEEAWKTRRYRTYAELARERELAPGEVRRHH